MVRDAGFRCKWWNREARERVRPARIVLAHFRHKTITALVDSLNAFVWLKVRAEKAEVVTTVCTGTAILAHTGLLDGRRATTNKSAFKWVAEQTAKVNWVRQARWVEDGKFATSSGVSAGIDMALAVMARLYSTETAEKIAIEMEYEWHRDASWDPFAKIHGLV